MELRNVLHACCWVVALTVAPAFAAQRATTTSMTQAEMEPAMAAIRLKNFKGAAQLLEPMAQQGQAEAQYLLACLYRAGLGVTGDPAKERALLTGSANQNHANAAYSLSLSLLREEPRDPDGSRRWLEVAARAGHLMAQRSLKRGSLPLEFLPAADLQESTARLSAFWFAAESDDAALVDLLANPDVMAAANEFGRDALMRAAEAGAAQSLQALLKRTADPKRADQFGTTALMLASASGNAESVAALVRAGANVDAQDSVGNTALMHAARLERVDTIRVLLAAMASTAKYSARNVEGWTALDWALRGESNESIQALRAAGISATVPKGEASTPSIPLRRAAGIDLYAGWSDLGVGASRSSADVVNALLGSARAQPWTANEIRAALANAVTTGNASTAERLLPAVRALGSNASSTAAVDPKLLDWAIRHGDSKMVAVLLPLVPPAATGKGLESPVLAATRTHQAGILQVLLDSGFDVAATDKQGRDALMVATHAKRLDLVELLLRHRADPAHFDQEGRSALWYAAQTDFIEGARLLLRPENRDREDKLGITPIAAAASEGHTELVSLLLSNGVSANGPARSAMPPLLLASANGHGATVQRLLAAGATPDAAGAFGNTALIVAAKNGHAAVVKQLLAAGAKRQLRNSDGNSASDIADALNNAELEAVLKSG